MRIALDAMGGDNAPQSTVRGAFAYLEELGDQAADIILVGIKEQLEPLVKEYGSGKRNITILHAADVVTMDDRPASVIRTKPESSLVKSIQLVKNGEADAIVSAGNTGALLASSLLLLGKIPGIQRPALAPHIPGPRGGFIICDVGANTDVRPQHLVQFGIMAAAYMEHLEGKKNPRIGLLNIGIEENKGNELTQAAYPLMKEHMDNFVGNIEARYILDGKVDVVVCDGFVGNTVLKFIEGVTSHMVQWFRQKISDSENSEIIFEKMGPIFREMALELDYEEYGGTPLLGIAGIVLKAHGDSTYRSIKNVLIAAQRAHDKNLIRDIASQISQHIIED
ncbi:MAG: phosphate acyltransferase PlsX [FCB group bacterium]|nr:phosphate acyltransferase PlsX [FCB group bacterium]